MAKTPLEIASLARMHTKKAVKTLAAIMNEPHAPYAAPRGSCGGLAGSWLGQAEASKNAPMVTDQSPSNHARTSSLLPEARRRRLYASTSMCWLLSTRDGM